MPHDDNESCAYSLCSMASTSFYVVLELSKAASADDIKAAYRRLAKARHPDKNLNNPNATALFQQVRRSSCSTCQTL